MNQPDGTVFRKARAADMESIMRLIREAQAFMRTLDIDQWQDGYPDARTLQEDIRIGQLYVFAEDGGIRAVAALSLLREPIYDALEGQWLSQGPYLTIHRMALDDSSRGKGLALRMLERAEILARQHNCQSVRADTHPGNLAMRRFLEKNGFVHCGLVYYPVQQGNPRRVAYEKLM